MNYLRRKVAKGSTPCAEKHINFFYGLILKSIFLYA